MQCQWQQPPSRSEREAPYRAGRSTAWLKIRAATEMSCRCAIKLIAPWPKLRRRCGSRMRQRIAAAKAGASPMGVISPVSPCSTTEGTPPLRPATTGVPAACASSSTMPQASLIAGQTNRSTAA